MNERFKELLKALYLTQKAFAKKILACYLSTKINPRLLPCHNNFCNAPYPAKITVNHLRYF